MYNIKRDPGQKKFIDIIKAFLENRSVITKIVVKRQFTEQVNISVISRERVIIS